ncbi:MAG: T9SS type A sorting domain-containing protein [Bacteroidetes bacterium]|nr:T9SS type A sorting domain-containing protein [Bacteroidota bacterium]
MTVITMLRIIFILVAVFIFSKSNGQGNYSLDLVKSDDYIILDSALNITGIDGLTFGVWVNLPKIPASDGNAYFIADMAVGSSNSNYSHRFTIGQHKNEFTFTGEGSKKIGWNTRTSSNGFEGKWTFLTCAVSTKTDSSYLYLNGKLKSKSAVSNPNSEKLDFHSYYESMILGARAFTKQWNQNFKLDQLSVWNYSMTEKEVHSLYNTCLSGFEKGLIAFWDFEEGTGSTSFDASKSYKAWLINSPSWSSDVTGHSCSSCLDSVVVFDTIPVYDTIAIFDTVRIFDSIKIITNDTISIFDTLVIYDSISVTDTLYINTTFTSINSIHHQFKVYFVADELIVDNGDYMKVNSASIEIININGQPVFQSDINLPIFRISKSQFGSKGTYIIRVLNDKNEILETRKIIFQ